MELAEKWMCFSDNDVVGYVAGVQGLSSLWSAKNMRLRGF